MKKGELVRGRIEEIRFPDKGILRIGTGDSCREVTVKNTLPGQLVSARITKKRAGRAEAALTELLEPSPEETAPACPKFGTCGGCQYLSLPAETELRIKEEQVRALLRTADPGADQWYEGVLESPVTEGYRNKMELTFGDETKDGPLTLGMHRRGSFYDVVDADECRIADEDTRRIIRAARDYWAGTGVPFYHRMRHEGYLRHLLIRKGMKTGEILIDLVTTTQTKWAEDPESLLLQGFAETLMSLSLEGRICGILHTCNDSAADIVEDQGTQILYGKSSFEEELLGLRFTVTPFSFFQTNSAGAELLYSTARRFLADARSESDPMPAQAPETTQLSEQQPAAGPTSRLKTASDPVPAQQSAAGPGRGPVVFDLYCGTGTISLLMAPAASKVIGVEIVEEAVLAARKNASENGIQNCEFIAGDVLKVLDEIEEKPDLIILDPPRDGVHPKALPKILRFGVPYILYISCKPTSLVRDLPVMEAAGYHVLRGVSVNQFPKTANVETCVLLSNLRKKPDDYIDLTLDMKEYYRIAAGGEKP